MKTLSLSAFALAFLALAVDKIHNEHRMTAMYERQAVALERIEDALELGSARGWQGWPVATLPKYHYPLAQKTMEQLADQAMKDTDADFCRNHKWPKEIEREQCGK